MPVHYVREKKRWRFQFNRVVRGRRTRASKLLPRGWSRARAEKYDRDETGRLYALATGVERPKLTIAHALAAYLKYRVPDLKNGKKAAQDLRHLVPYIDGKGLDELDDVCSEYRRDHEALLAPGTIRNRLAYLRAAVGFAYKKRKVGDRDYRDLMSLPAADNERQVYARAPDLRRLWAGFEDPEDRALFRLAYYCGVRWRSEMRPRQPEDVVRTRRDVWIVVGTTKNGEPRMAWVHQDAREDLRFLPFRKKDWRYYRAYRAARASAGRPDLVPHDLRHSLASQIISSGGTLSDVQGALHHKTPASSNRYAHLYPERVKRAIQHAVKMPTSTRKKKAA